MLSEILRDLNSAVIISIIIGLIFIKIPESYFLARNIRLVEFLIEIKEFESAEAIILECFKKNPNKSKLFDLYGRLLIEKKNLTLAEKILLRGLEKSNKYSQLHYHLAIIYLLTENIKKAKEHNEYVIKKFRKNPKALQQKIIILFKQEKYSDIINCYEINLKYFEKNEIIHEEIIAYTLFSAAQLNDLERYNKLLGKLSFEDLKNNLNSYNILISSYLIDDKQTMKKMINYIDKHNVYEYLTKEQISNIKKIEEDIKTNPIMRTIEI